MSSDAVLDSNVPGNESNKALCNGDKQGWFFASILRPEDKTTRTKVKSPLPSRIDIGSRQP